MREILGSMVLFFVASSVCANPATTLKWDVSGYSFYNACTDEWVRPELGETLQAVIRYTEEHNGVHLVNRMAGHVSAYGVSTGDSYGMSALMTPLPFFQNVQLQDGDGAVQTFIRWEIVKPADPVGVSISQQVLRIVFRGNDVVDVTAEPLDTVCSGGSQI